MVEVYDRKEQTFWFQRTLSCSAYDCNISSLKFHTYDDKDSSHILLIVDIFFIFSGFLAYKKVSPIKSP
jgi:hypothetical protein